MARKPKISLVTSTPTAEDPAAQFGEAGRQLWKTVTDEYRIDDAGGTILLEQICHAADRVAELADQIASDGSVIYVKCVPKAHPALRDELANRAFIARNLQRLGITVEQVKPVGRPAGFSPNLGR